MIRRLPWRTPPPATFHEPGAANDDKATAEETGWTFSSLGFDLGDVFI